MISPQLLAIGPYVVPVLKVVSIALSAIVLFYSMQFVCRLMGWKW